MSELQQKKHGRKKGFAGRIPRLNKRILRGKMWRMSGNDNAANRVRPKERCGDSPVLQPEMKRKGADFTCCLSVAGKKMRRSSFCGRKAVVLYLFPLLKWTVWYILQQ